jgi:hypothetical protein
MSSKKQHFTHGVICLFYCYWLRLGSKKYAMQNAFVKTSVSMPSDMLDWLKETAAAEGRMPVSRIIAQAVREKMDRQKDNNRKATK